MNMFSNEKKSFKGGSSFATLPSLVRQFNDHEQLIFSRIMLYKSY